MGHTVGFMLVHDAVGEFVQRSHMIDVGMGRYRADRLPEEMLSGLVEARDTHPGVNDQVAVAALNVPDVALFDADDVGFPDPRDAVGESLVVEPAMGDL